MERVDDQLITELARHEPRSTLAIGAVLAAGHPRDARVVRYGDSLCVIVRREPLVWLGYPRLADPRDAPGLARAIEATPVVGLDGHPEDVDPLLEHMQRAGETEHFVRVVTPAEQCGWAPSGSETRLATILDLDALEAVFAGYEVVFVSGKRARRAYLRRCIQQRGAVVHDGERGVDAAVLTSGPTPNFMILEHLRVMPEARGQGISWMLVSRVVEMAQAYGVGLLGSVVEGNPMSIPQDQGWLEQQTSVNLRLPDRFPGERRFRRTAHRLARRRRR